MRQLQQQFQQAHEALAVPQPQGLPPRHVVPWQQPPVWSTSAAPAWPQVLQQPWDPMQQQVQQALPVWDPSMGPAWDPMQQQWAAAPAAAQQAQQAQQQWPSSAARTSHPGLGWQAQAAVQQPQQRHPGMQQPGQAQGRSQGPGPGQHATKLQRDVPPGGPAEAFLCLAVRIYW